MKLSRHLSTCGIGALASVTFALSSCGSPGRMAASSPPQTRAASAVAVSPAAALTGTWKGNTQAGRLANMGTTLVLGVSKSTLAYATPWQCTLDIQSNGTPPNSTVYDYDVVSSNGGHCDVALDGQLLVTPRTGQDILISLFDMNGNRIDQGTLTRISTP